MAERRESRPGGVTEAAENRWDATPATVPATTDYYATHFAGRCVQDAINSGLAQTWERRRASFLAARPRIGDFHGRATREELRARYDELTAIAVACAARASVSVDYDGIDADVWEAIAC